MKTKQQKQDELKRGDEFISGAKAVLLVDFNKVGTSDLRNLRKQLKAVGSRLFIMKKRVMNLLFKNKGLEYSAKDLKTSVGAVFVENLESASSTIYKFFAGLEKEKKIEGNKILGGYNLTGKEELDAARVIMIGKLPPREALLAQLFGMLSAPIRSFLYVLDQKSKANS